MWTLLVVAVSFLIILYAEYLSRRKGLHSELSRKLVHVLGGTFAAFWPFFLSWRQIQVLSLVFLVAMIVSVKFHLFRSIHGVERTASGEILAVLIVLLLSFITSDPWVFMVAMLHLALADGFAAVAGLAWGDHNGYKVLGHTRTLAGSLTFFFISLLIMTAYALWSGNPYSVVTQLWMPVAATIAENFAIKGTDNIVIPLLVAFILMSAS
jgi:phytol kinase